MAAAVVVAAVDVAVVAVAVAVAANKRLYCLQHDTTKTKLMR